MDKTKRAIGIFVGLSFLVPMTWGMYWLLTHEASRAHWWVAVICFGLSLARIAWSTIKDFCGAD